MTFIEYGLNIRHPTPAKTDTEKGYVIKTSSPQASKAIEDELHHEPESGNNSGFHNNGEHAQEAYRQIIDDIPSEPVITAAQIMSSPAITINSQVSIRNAISVFKQHKCKHLPVIDNTDNLLGMISDRDLLHYTSVLTRTFDIKNPDYNIDNSVMDIMMSPVLTATTETDVRYISQLFVKQHIGALPVMEQHLVVGIISRTDILRAVMNHFKLELWV